VEDPVERAYQLAYKYEREHHGCAESTLLAIQETFHLGDDVVRRSASGLLAGVAFMGSVCGALIAGVMALGMKFGRPSIERPIEGQTELFRRIIRLRRMFKREFGSCLCHEIQRSLLGRSFNLADPSEYEAFKRAGGYEKCPEVVAKTARMVAELLIEAERRPQ